MAKVAKNKQMAVLNYIHKQVEDHGYPPTVREICSAVGLSSTSTGAIPSSLVLLLLIASTFLSLFLE